MKHSALFRYIAMIRQGATFRDKATLARYFLTGNRKLSRYVTIRNEAGIYYCGDDMGDVWVASSFHEPHLQRHFEFDGGVFVDVGANVGKYTIKVANRLAAIPRSKVVAIEAEAGNFAKMRESVRLNGLDNVILENAACYSEDGEIELHLNEIARHHSVVKSEYRNSEECVTVRARKLDTILAYHGIDRVRFIKIDVEGAEVKVLEGASRTLAQDPRPRILFEAWNGDFLDEIVATISPFGYEVERISDIYYLAR